ncbi:MAG TPA: hypothetical protein VGI97_00485 [Gemmatimonadaceae bacterium]|jgi:hypothetical protein
MTTPTREELLASLARVDAGIDALKRENAELRAALQGVLGWYASLIEPGSVPESADLHARLREARAALKTGAAR